MKKTRNLVESNTENLPTQRPASIYTEFNPKLLSVPLTILSVLSLCFMLFMAAPILIPVFFAIYLNILLSPLVMYLKTKGIAVTVSSGALIMMILILLGGAIMQLGEPAEQWLKKAPRALLNLENRVLSFSTPFSDIQKISEKVEELTELTETSQQDKKVSLEVAKPSFLKQLADSLPATLAALAIIVFLTFFLLSAGDNFLRKLVKLGSNYSQRKQIFTIIKTIQRDVAHHLRSISLINTILGICVFLVMWLIEVPNPLLWGVLAMVLNFIPYLGPLIMMGMLCLVGILNYPSFTEALYPPLLFAGLNVLESQLLTPAVLGKQLSLSPAVIFLAVVFWSWLWGISGALLAVPIMVSIKVMLDNLPNFARLSQLMDR